MGKTKILNQLQVFNKQNDLLHKHKQSQQMSITNNLSPDIYQLREQIRMKEAQAQILRARLAQLEPFVNKSEVEQEVDQRIQQLQQIIAKKKREDALDCKRTVETEKSSQRTEHGKYSSCQVTLVKPITSRRKPLSPLTDRQLLELHNAFKKQHQVRGRRLQNRRVHKTPGKCALRITFNA